MKIIIAGSREITSFSLLKDAIAQNDFSIGEVVSGCARGVDKLGERWATEHGIPIKRMRANWGKFGAAAGQYRNWEMAEYADGLLALWDEESRGTLHMIDCMKRLGKSHVVYGRDGLLHRHLV